MLYWGIMGLLVVVALGLIITIVVTLKKNSGRQEGYDYDDYDEYDEEEPYEEEVQPVRARAQKSRQEEPERQQAYEESQPAKKTKKQWKVILENLDTWEKFSYIFYDNIGIGRSRSDGEFEKFMTIRDDPRVSKIHCVILREKERLYLKDMGSRNGTYLNGQRIYQLKEIQRDDVIGVGQTQIEVKKVLRERD